MWKWMGALIMKPKSDGNGGTHMAVDFTKLQKLVSLMMSVALFVVIIVLCLVRSQMLESGVVSDPVPAPLLQMFWGTLGMNGVNMAAGAYFGKKNGKA
jgi:tetrahydromethanopterin S-methyltransferase subunit E